MAIKLGINPLTWTNDDLPYLGSETTLEQCLREGRQAGFTGFELGNKFPRESNDLRRVLAQYDLELISGWYSGKLLQQSVAQEISDLQEHLQLLKKGGSSVMVYCEVTGCIHDSQQTPLSNRPSIQAKDWKQFGNKLSLVADYCLQHDVQLAYHHHMGTVVETVDDIDQLMKHTSQSLGLLLDCGHITYAGGEPLELIKKHGSRIVHVHAKDIRLGVLNDAQDRNLSFLDAVMNGVFTVPGDGDINFQAIFSALKELNYQGWLVVEAEQDPAVAPSLAYAILGYNHIHRIARQAGFEIS